MSVHEIREMQTIRMKLTAIEKDIKKILALLSKEEK